MTDTIRTTVRLPSSIQQQIEALARARGISGVDVVRSAIEEYLQRVETDRESGGINLQRLALITEFSQAGVDVLLRQLPANKRDEVIRTVEQRMEQFHGQK
ncbi:MAG: CopG family transcriptional regulator [Parasphingorhabdus sp.]|mgnify:FL=1|uniref:CopG family transcriptional regulator n=1 Tax=Parasphingorhabdus sp. TaxID=2709688 RepID=UPI0030011DF1